jgi:outer membrane lipoprotein-sorting protein
VRTRKGIVTTKVTRALALLAAILIPSPADVSENAPDPQAVLSAAARTYAALRSYHFVSQTEITPPDGSDRKTMGQVLARSWDGKTRHEMDTPLGRIVTVSDGKTEWTFFPASGEYMVSAPGSGPLSSLNEDFVGSYAAVDRSLVQRAAWLRTETLTVGKQRALCDVVRVELAAGRPAYPDPEADRLWRAEWTGVPKTYWIDRAQHRILRVLVTSAKGARQETTYIVVRINEDLPATLFQSPVPAGAKKLELPH